MGKLGVIERVERATQWCPPMVAAKKNNNSLSICVDYKQLNERIVSPAKPIQVGWIKNILQAGHDRRMLPGPSVA